jgi:hypothetical protein
MASPLSKKVTGEREKIISQMDELISILDRTLHAGLDKESVKSLKQTIREATPLLARSQEVMVITRPHLEEFNIASLRSRTVLLTTQSRMVRKCHLATMAVVYFQLGQLKFIRTYFHDGSQSPPAESDSGSCGPLTDSPNVDSIRETIL